MFMTDDIRVAMDKAEIDRLLADCAEGLDGAEVQTIDGVRLVWPNGWLLVRRSITEPKVTIRLEGETGDDLERSARPSPTSSRSCAMTSTRPWPSSATF